MSAGLVKPDAKIYHLACQRLHVVPGHALFVGDGGSDELVGATNAGMTAYWATWFLDRWLAGFIMGRESAESCPKFRKPEELVAVVAAMR